MPTCIFMSSIFGARKGVGWPETGDTQGYEAQYGCQEWNLGFLVEQVNLTTELSIQFTPCLYCGCMWLAASSPCCFVSAPWWAVTWICESNEFSLPWVTSVLTFNTRGNKTKTLSEHSSPCGEECHKFTSLIKWKSSKDIHVDLRSWENVFYVLEGMNTKLEVDTRLSCKIF